MLDDQDQGQTPEEKCDCSAACSGPRRGPRNGNRRPPPRDGSSDQRNNRGDNGEFKQ